MTRQDWLTKIETREYGTLYLLPDLRIDDIIQLDKMIEQVSPREFAVEVVHRLLDTPPLERSAIGSWNDELLQYVAIGWIQTGSLNEWELPDNLPPYEAFQHGYRTYVADFKRSIWETFNTNIAPAFEAMQASMRQVLSHYAGSMQRAVATVEAAVAQIGTGFANMGPAFQINMDQLAASMRTTILASSIFDTLPDYREIAKRLVELKAAADTVDAGGYKFLLHYWEMRDLSSFVATSHVDSRVRNAAVTNRLLALTRREDFKTVLMQNFSESSVVKRRWRIVETALVAHRNRVYALSIPVLLSQIEGMFTDVLIVIGTVKRRKGKLYAKNADGSLKLGKDGKPVMLRGLGQVITNSDIGDEEGLQLLADVFTDWLIPERNAILHGRNVSYDKAKLSVQLVLIIYVLSLEFALFEDQTS